MTDVLPLAGGGGDGGVMPLHDVLVYAGRAESSSEHPLGRAIFKYAEEKGVDCSEGCVDFVGRAGRGLECTVGTHSVLIGNVAWMEEKGQAHEHTGPVVSYVCVCARACLLCGCIVWGPLASAV